MLVGKRKHPSTRTCSSQPVFSYRSDKNVHICHCLSSKRLKETMQLNFRVKTCRFPSFILCVLYEMKWSRRGKGGKEERHRHTGQAVNGNKNWSHKSRWKHRRVFARAKVTAHLSDCRTEDPGSGTRQAEVQYRLCPFYLTDLCQII